MIGSLGTVLLVWAHPDDDIYTSAGIMAAVPELKRRGFRFVGPTTVYAFMQSAGFVDDHHRIWCGFEQIAELALRAGDRVSLGPDRGEAVLRLGDDAGGALLGVGDHLAGKDV